MANTDPIASLWRAMDSVRPEYAFIKPILQEKGTHNSIQVRKYSLPNSEIQVHARLRSDGEVEAQLNLVSGRFCRDWPFLGEPEHILVSCFWRIEKYMFVLETITGLTDVRMALAQDASVGNTMSLDVILQPMSLFTAPQFRLIIDIPVDPSLLATITFFERFWITPTHNPVLRRRHAKHFASTATLARFVQRKRK